MTFISDFADDGAALIDAASGRTVTYAELNEICATRQSILAGGQQLVFLFVENNLESALEFLALQRAGHAVALLDRELKAELRDRLVARYRPALAIGLGPAEELHGYRHVDNRVQICLETSNAPLVHPDLSVLLTTSGSTGSPKFVRLSHSNLKHNARAIAQSLSLSRGDRAFANLPIHYSYGLSVLTSHLAVGATVVISDASVVEPRMWDQFRQHAATSLCGVPYTYQMLDRIGFLEMDLPSLRTMTQAGGKLSERLVAKFHSTLTERGVSFYVMYGQTEAAPRIACLPPEWLPEKMGSAGRALAGGRLWIATSHGDSESGQAPPTMGEVLYEGPNVMMGYAEGVDDLSLGDVQGNVLRTGDLGYVDNDCFLFITGRTKRIGKIFGTRVNLDEIERMIAWLGRVAVTSTGDKLYVFHECPDEETIRCGRKELAKDLKIPIQALVFKTISPIPILANGKTDYRQLERHQGVESR